MPFSPSASRSLRTQSSFAMKLVQDCLREALAKGASDVHLQPRSDCWEISFRIDGVLQLVNSVPQDEDSDPVARLMALAGLPSYRGGVPQEGTFRWSDDSENEREMRVGVFPTVHGNRAAIRIMEDRVCIRQLDQLGFDETTRSGLQSVCDARDGWLLVAGPAGSGKTTTLYACLSQIASGPSRRSVLTIEDPVESVIDSISQSQLQGDAGLTLAGAMRSAVRQDAEVLLVSEIRDVETAEAVLSASMTGHLCFSSIHSSSIGTTLRRLVQMKLPTFAIQSGLRGILCQRLLRQLCQRCGQNKLADSRCDQCHGTGYRGRIPIVQMVRFDGSGAGQMIFDAVESNQTADELDAVASEAGIPSLHDQANRLIETGITDQDEVFRVLGRKR